MGAAVMAGADRRRTIRSASFQSPVGGPAESRSPLRYRRCTICALIPDVRRRRIFERSEGSSAELGLVLPAELPPPAGAYEPFRLINGWGSLAAQVPGYGREAPRGRVGAELTVEQGRLASRMCALNALGRIDQALGGFDRLVGLLHVAGHVASSEDFLEQPGILDGASELFVAALGERGRHSRTAYPAARLPKDIPIELEITFVYSA